MNKLITILTTFILLFNLSITSSANYHANTTDSYQSCENTEIIDLGDGFTIEYETVEIMTTARTSTKTASKTGSCKYDGKTIGKITLTATFSYNGSSATCTSASATYETYDGWSCYNKSTTRSGNSATASATFQKGLKHATISVTMKCSKTGVIS